MNSFPTETAPKPHKKEEKKEVATKPAEPTLSHTNEYTNHVTWRHASNILMALQILLLILFARCSTMEGDYSNLPGRITSGYFYFGGIEIMMFIGFGYLMTFMKTYGLGAVGFTMLVTAIGLQWYLFCESFFEQMYNNYNYPEKHQWHYVHVNIYSLMDCLFGVSSVLISLGAVIGKIKPTQLIVMTILGLVFHAFNYQVVMIGSIKLVDVGGTYVDHMFGAYFGLTVAMVLTSSAETYHQRLTPATGYAYDLFSLIGTLFLWIYWPSFVGGALPADSNQQSRAVVNTILALSSSTIMTYYLSSFFNPLANKHPHHYQFRPVDIQNATLAGGVAIGSIANLSINPVNAIFVGLAAGGVSTAGYHFIQPLLQEKFNLHDTCGINNLHGMPSIIGAIASILLAGYKQYDGRNHDMDVYGTAHSQWWRQFVAMLLCITCAVGTGLFTGLVMKYIDPITMHDKAYDDGSYWEVAPGYNYRYGVAELEDRPTGLFQHNDNASELNDSVHSYIGTAYTRGGAIRGGGSVAGSVAGGSAYGGSVYGGSAHGSAHGEQKQKQKQAMTALNDDEETAV